MPHLSPMSWILIFPISWLLLFMMVCNISNKHLNNKFYFMPITTLNQYKFWLWYWMNKFVMSKL